MRLSITLIFLAILITFSSSYFLLSQTESNNRMRTDVHQVDGFKKLFEENYSPVQKMDLAKMYARSDAKSLIDPAYKLYHTHLYNYGILQFFIEFKNNCRNHGAESKPFDPSWISKSQEDRLNALLVANKQSPENFKAILKLFHFSYLMDCNGQNGHIKFHFGDENKAKDIWIDEDINSKDFIHSKMFKIEPFMHPFGNSFALMALMALPQDTLAQEKTKWIEENLDYFHAQELPLLSSYSINPPLDFAILADLSKDGLQALSNHENIVLGKNYVLLHANSDSGFSNSEFYPYVAYKMSTFEKALQENAPYLKVKESSHDKSCLVEESNLCWYQDTDKMDAFLKRYTIVFFAASMFVVFIMVFTVYKRIAEEKHEEEKKKFALQTLTHELRTPLTSMTIALENLRPAFDRLNSVEQGAFGRVLSDSARLMRLADASRQYLSSAKSKQFLNLKPAHISSFNDFFEDTLDMFAGKIETLYLSDDISFISDIYWLGICIKNLVDNALEHGVTPVVVSAKMISQEIHIAVQDQGEVAFDSFDQMKSAFVKNNASQGLGLGLNLVERIIHDMGGRLEFTKLPTTFTLIIPLISKTAPQ